MSWLARSMASPQHPDQENDHDSTSSSGGVKDFSELTESFTRKLRGVTSFLSPPPATSPQSGPFVSYGNDGDPCITGEHNEDDQMKKSEGGVTEEALAFARNISNHPETWLDFPLSEQEDYDDDFEMSDTQWEHATLVEHLAPRLAALRIELCPIHMSESYFWKVYFILLHSRLNKHDAYLLSTPQIVAARSMWMKELQKRSKPDPELFETNTSHQSNSVHDDFTTTKRSAHAFEPTNHNSLTQKYTFPNEKLVDQEVGLTRTTLDHRTSSSYTIPTADYGDDDDNDDWVHENLELNGYVGADIYFGTDEDISFSDLETDDDCKMPIQSKVV